MATRILTVPNQLTFLRLGFLPFFIIMIFYQHYTWALGILLIAGMTDGLDGLLARTLNQKTSLGAYLDPIADKLLLSSSFVALALEGQIRWWLTILVLGRDILILITAAVILATIGYRRSRHPSTGRLQPRCRYYWCLRCCWQSLPTAALSHLSGRAWFTSWRVLRSSQDFTTASSWREASAIRIPKRTSFFELG